MTIMKDALKCWILIYEQVFNQDSKSMMIQSIDQNSMLTHKSPLHAKFQVIWSIGAWVTGTTLSENLDFALPLFKTSGITVESYQFFGITDLFLGKRISAQISNMFLSLSESIQKIVQLWVGYFFACFRSMLFTSFLFFHPVIESWIDLGERFFKV